MDVIKKTKKLIKDFKEEYSSELERIRSLSKKLREVCMTIERTWSGSFAGWHGSMYYRDFQIPSIHERFSGEWGGINGIPDGWEEKQPEEVQKKIEELVGDKFSTKKFEDDLKKIRKKIRKFHTEIMINLSSFSFNNATEEKKLFTQIESFAFGKTKSDYIKEGLPKNMMSRDTEALRQGIYVASWLYYEGVALEGKSICESIDTFFLLIDRLIRQLKRKSELNEKKIDTGNDYLVNLHTEIYNKCYELYEKRAYAEAAEKSFKVVRDRLRKLTRYETGSEAFGKGKLHIKGAAAENVDQDFNEAVKFLTMAIDRFRNEKSHTSDGKIDDPVRAYEYLRLSSLAMNLLDRAEILS